MPKWGVIWGSYTAAVLAGFGVLEYAGVQARNRGDRSGTLTATLRRGMGIDPKSRRRAVLAPAFAALLGWLAVHILTSRW